MLRNGGSDGLSEDPQALHTGCNSGYQAINLAVLAGAKRVPLIGYDCKVGDGGKMHWFGDHPVKTPASVFQEMRKKFRTAIEPLHAAGVEVLNCTPGSALDAFARAELESVLPDPSGAALPA